MPRLGPTALRAVGGASRGLGLRWPHQTGDCLLLGWPAPTASKKESPSAPPLPPSDAGRGWPMPGRGAMSTNNRPAQTGGPGRQNCPGPALETGLMVRATGSDTPGGSRCSQTSPGQSNSPCPTVHCWRLWQSGSSEAGNSPHMPRGSPGPRTGPRTGSPGPVRSQSWAGQTPISRWGGPAPPSDMRLAQNSPLFSRVSSTGLAWEASPGHAIRASGCALASLRGTHPLPTHRSTAPDLPGSHTKRRCCHVSTP